MDNRLIFLYHMISELWGRKERMEEPGMEKPVQVRYPSCRQIRMARRIYDAE